MKTQTIIFSLLASIALPSFAAPVEFDTPDAHIIVLRSLDAWSGNNSTSKDSLSSVGKHEGGFLLARKKGFENGYPFVFQGISNDIVVQGVNSALKQFDFKLSNTKDFTFKIEKASALDPLNYTAFADKQRELYKYLVISEGNPQTLPGRVQSKQFLNTIISIGTLAIAAEKFGSVGSDTLLNSGISGDLSQLSASNRAALAPVDLPSFDASNYKAIDVLPVIQGLNDRMGQIIIAYKNERTDDVQNTALIQAIVSLTGADTTVAAIQQARDEDLVNRQTIWDTCVAEDKCKKE